MNTIPYNPALHHRRSLRLKGYDYSQAGMYFITICCQNDICRFGTIENGEMVLNEYGQIAHNEWAKLPERYPNMVLDVFQIMPNHIHGVIALCNTPMDAAVGATLTVAQNENTFSLNENTEIPYDANVLNYRAGASPAPTSAVMFGDWATARVAPTNVTKPIVGAIVGAYKSLVTNKCLEIYKSRGEYMGKLFQRDYWEHIIRNDQSYQYIADYIVNNPSSWEKDKFYNE